MKPLGDKEAVALLEPLILLGSDVIAFTEVRSFLASIDMDTEEGQAFIKQLKTVSDLVDIVSK